MSKAMDLSQVARVRDLITDAMKSRVDSGSATRAHVCVGYLGPVADAWIWIDGYEYQISVRASGKTADTAPDLASGNGD